MEESPIPMSVLSARVHHRSVRAYASKWLNPEMIGQLLAAVAPAPTDRWQEQRAYVVVQGRRILRSLLNPMSITLSSTSIAREAAGNRAVRFRVDRDLNRFDNADTLILICSEQAGPSVTVDCWLAAESLMRKACSMGLTSCVFVSAIAALNTPLCKRALDVPDAMHVIAPVTIGLSGGGVRQFTRGSLHARQKGEAGLISGSANRTLSSK